MEKIDNSNVLTTPDEQPQDQSTRFTDQRNKCDVIRFY